jgi:hypothetical protein
VPATAILISEAGAMRAYRGADVIICLR